MLSNATNTCFTAIRNQSTDDSRNNLITLAKKIQATLPDFIENNHFGFDNVTFDNNKIGLKHTNYAELGKVKIPLDNGNELNFMIRLSQESNFQRLSFQPTETCGLGLIEGNDETKLHNALQAIAEHLSESFGADFSFNVNPEINLTSYDEAKRNLEEASWFNIKINPKEHAVPRIKVSAKGDRLSCTMPKNPAHPTEVKTYNSQAQRNFAKSLCAMVN